MTPSVRGREKVVVAAVLVGSAASSGALAGFAAGLIWSVTRVGDPARPVVIALVTVALVADAVYRVWGRVRPWSTRRQVPRAWSRLFAPPTVALLYGARLGVGPLTILPSWLWWAALVLAAATGPGTAAVAGAVFGGLRTLVMVALAEWVHRCAVPRMARLRAVEPAAALLLAPVAVAAAMLA